jgi:hypothetical protein
VKNNTSIRVKAFILLTVFFLNTAVGFACSLGVNMGFNSKHQHRHDNAKTSIHVHKDGKAHTHNKGATKGHTHDKTQKHNHGNGKDNCCNDQVLKFQNLDKAVKPVNTLNAPSLYYAVYPQTYTSQINFSAVHTADKYVIPNSHPPPRDIYILVQSFLI